MKRSIIALALLLCLGLSGCSAMLERSYEVSAPHVDRPTTAEDSSTLRVKDYRELVSAVLYLVSQGEETGVIQLYDYAGDVEADLAAACLEVATQDPLGAYCVDYIRHETTRVVSYHQATLSLYYRRTPEQVASMVNVTGTSAIRAELRQALGSFDQEVVLRVAYLAEDRDSLSKLVRQTYYDTPVTALGMPQVEINLYPDSGSQRVVEILLTYPESPEELTRRSQRVADILEIYDLGSNTSSGDQADMARYVLGRIRFMAEYDPEAGGTLYDTLVEERANSEGFALAYAVFCGQFNGGPVCNVVEGTLQGEPRFLNSLHFSDGSVGYVDPCTEDYDFHTAQEMVDMGYLWEGAPAVEETATEEGPEGEKTEEIQ